jgi:type VI secretion system protein VasG
VKALKPELDKTFKPAFLGRMVIIPYFPILDDAMKQIIRLKLGKIERRLMETHKVNLEYDESMVEEVAQRCTEVESGARNVDNILTNTLLPEISIRLLESLAEGTKPQAVRVEVGEAGTFQYSAT